MLLLLSTYSPKNCTPDYYRFSLLKSGNEWLIHGLWIEQCNACGVTCGYPTFCNNIPFNISDLTPLFTPLSKNWYPGGDPNKNTLLSHEWSKHGTCFDNWTQYQYFNTSLGIYDQIIDNNLLSTCNKSSCYFLLDDTLNFR